jgi:hypothetical protein
MSESIDWLRPVPLWQSDGRAFIDFFAPTLLEFASDNFMDDFLAAAGSTRADKLRALAMERPAGGVLKLFQPVHGRFYLVCSSLCCRIPGFPDRVVRRADDERVSFVLRRLVNGVEHGWAGPDQGRRWQPLTSPRALLEDEERLPMAETTSGGGRTLFFGYLPVSSGDTYKLPPLPPTDPDAADFPDTRVEELGSRFTRPLTGDLEDGQPVGRTMAIREISDELARTASVYLLLDAYDWFADPANLPDVAAVLAGEPGAALVEPKLAQKQALLDHLNVQPPGELSLAKLIGDVAKKRQTLNQQGGVEGDDKLDLLGLGGDFNLKPGPNGPHPRQADLLTLLDLARAALPDELPAVTLPKLSQRDDERYLVRCVYERPMCAPEPVIVSQPSQPFRLAPFFDPDAPARPVRIPLPGDVSIAGLRKFKKNVSFIMSDAMRSKMESLTGAEQKVLDGDKPNPEQPFELAFICSFSIQIIFIVAFMLLLIFVFVLNIIFSWIIFFRICLPIPKSWAPK